MSDSIDCSYAENYCRFDISCEDVSEGFKMPLEITMNDDTRTFNFNVNLRDYLVDGNKFPQMEFKKGKFCYIPVFQSVEEEADEDIWRIGSTFLDNHVLILDNTHASEKNETY